MLTHLHTRHTSLPFPAQTAQGHALMLRRWIAIHKTWMRRNPGQYGRERLRELVGVFREDIAALDREMARYQAATALVNFTYGMAAE